MTERYVDLHLHTTYSDGTFTPVEAVRHAKAVGLAAISITDHDTINGIPDAIDEGNALGVEVIPGIELSCNVVMKRASEMHILGFCINWRNGAFQEMLALFRKAREERAVRIHQRLEESGAPVDPDLVRRIAGGGAVGRLHFAKALIEAGHVETSHEAFYRYLSYGKPAFVPKMQLEPEDAIRMIRRVGGIAVLAHPYYGHYSNRNLLRGLVNAGLRGIEVWHSKHPPETVELFKGIAREMDLIATGGSDCHGPYGGDPAVMGNIKVPYAALEGLKRCKAEIDRDNAAIFQEAL